jgi:centrosomal protein CEP41
LTYATEQLGITVIFRYLWKDQTAFLLLDLRDPEDFDLYHIKESINFPAPSLSRDKLIPPLYRFVNLHNH